MTLRGWACVNHGQDRVEEHLDQGRVRIQQEGDVPGRRQPPRLGALGRLTARWMPSCRRR